MSKPDVISYQQIPQPANASLERGRPADLTPLEPQLRGDQVLHHVATRSSIVGPDALQFAYRMGELDGQGVESTLQYLEANGAPQEKTLAAWYRHQMAEVRGASQTVSESRPAGAPRVLRDRTETPPSTIDPTEHSEHGNGSEQKPFGFEKRELLFPDGVTHSDHRMSAIPRRPTAPI